MSSLEFTSKQVQETDNVATVFGVNTVTRKRKILQFTRGAFQQLSETLSNREAQCTVEDSQGG